MKDILKLSLFALQLGFAASAIFYSKQYHEDKSKNQHRLYSFYESEAKSKKKTRELNFGLYDNIINDLNKETAKKVTAKQAYNDLCRLYDVGDVISDAQYKDFVRNYDGTLDYWEEVLKQRYIAEVARLRGKWEEERATDQDLTKPVTHPNMVASPLMYEIEQLQKKFSEHKDEAKLKEEITQLVVREKKTVPKPDEKPVLLKDLVDIPFRQEIPLKQQMAEEAMLDPSYTQIEPLVINNTVEVGTLDSNNVFTRFCFALMCVNHIGITVAHQFRDDYYVRYIDQKQIVYQKIVKVLKKHVTRDFCIFEIAKQAKNFKDITGKFLNRDTDMQKVLFGQNAVLVKTKFDMHGDYPAFHTLKTLVKLDPDLRTITAKDGITEEPRTKINTIGAHTIAIGATSGPILTEAGDCGSPLVLLNPHSGKVKIVGFHIAATTNDSANCLLIQEDIAEFMTDLIYNSQTCDTPKKLVVPYNSHVTLTQKSNMQYAGLPVVGEADQNTYLPNKTIFWRSPLSLPDTEVEFEPSVLTDFDTRNKTGIHPLYLGMERWAHPQPKHINLDVLNRAVNDVKQIYYTAFLKNNITLRVLTKSEAINAKTDSGLKPITRDSSPGYPFTLYGKKKQDFLEIHTKDNEVFYSIKKTTKAGQFLNASIDELIDISRTPNQRPFVGFSAFLKDEPIKTSKVYDVRTRVFMASPMSYTIASRMYNGSFEGACVLCRSDLPAQIGINPNDTLEWHFMISKMLGISPIGFDADFRNWDTTVVAEFMKRVPEIKNYCYKMLDPNWSPQDDVIRSNLHAVLHKPMIFVPALGLNKTLILQAAGGQTSGQPATGGENCIIHLLYLLYAYYIIMSAYCPKFANLRYFLQLVKAIVFGDDGCYAVSPEIIEFFNFETFAQIMSTLNLECTPASKDGKILKYQNVIDLEFLKRTTVRIGSHWYGKLHSKTLVKMCSYARGKPHHYFKEPWAIGYKPADIELTIYACLRECIYHGRETFEMYYEHFQNCRRKYRWPFHILSYDDIKCEMEVYF